MKRTLCLLVALLLVGSVSWGQSVKEQFPNALEFSFSELEVNKGIVKSIEFDKYKCNLTLKNTEDSQKDVDILVIVFNEDGVVLWSKTEYWPISSLEPGQKYTVDWDFKPTVPASLEFSKFANTSTTPKWVAVLYKPSRELKLRY